MKRGIILSLALMLASVTTWAQSYFETFEKFDDVEYVYISKSLIGLIDNVESKGVKLKGISEKLDYVILIDMDKYVVVKGSPKNADELQPASVKAAHQVDIYMHNERYEQIMHSKDKDEITTIYVKNKKKDNKEIVIYNEDKEEISIVVINGRITKDDINKIAKM